jgi:hypothetical protein
VLALLGCADPPPAPPPAPPPPPPPAPILAPRPIATSAAVDLVASGDSAMLAWGVPSSQGGGVRFMELGPGGAPRGSEIELARRSAAAGGPAEQAPLQIIELSMAAAAGHVGVAWIVTPFDTSIVEAAYASSPGAFTAARELGTVDRYDSHTRGSVIVSSGADGNIWVTHRITRHACIATEGDCTRFTRERLDSSGGAGRGDEPLEVAAPCEPLLPGALSVAGRSYYGVCHAGDAQATTVYVIDPAVSYAAAAEVLPGCVPVGLAPAGPNVVLRAHCPDGEAMTRITETGRTPTTVRQATFAVRCDTGRPTLTAGAGAELAYALTASESRIEAWLPENIAPVGSRAVWTGEALLVAVPQSGEVALRRYECVEGELLRTDVR